MATRHKPINIEEGLQAVLDSFDDSETGDVDGFTSESDSNFRSAVSNATRTLDDSCVYCRSVDDHAVSESGNDDSRYENDFDDLDYCLDSDAILHKNN